MQEKIRRQSTKQKSIRVGEQRWNMVKDGGSGPWRGRGPGVCGKASDQVAASKTSETRTELDTTTVKQAEMETPTREQMGLMTTTADQKERHRFQEQPLWLCQGRQSV